jgi:hypothetical protein
MPSNKRDTNLSFTKRVDHEAGHTSDKHISEPAICQECEAIYTKGHWTFDKNVLKTNDFKKVEPQKTICPACHQIKTGEPAGFVFLEGDFFAQHKEEIENLLRNEAKHALEINPLARIMNWKEAKKRLTVETTTEHLAKHLGESLKHAYHGEVRYDFSHENKLARVYWKRD